jgi:NitT/TauT family transport system ATP-binding protein
MTGIESIRSAAAGARTGTAAADRAHPRQTYITVRALTKYFGASAVYDKFDLRLPQRKIISVFGPNGCGKSTLINLIAGLMPADSGEALFDGKTIRETTIGYVFQNYRDALFPWKRAIDNVRYPLDILGRSKSERDRRVDELIASFDVKFDLRRYPYELSGGQQQLVSIMRALAPNPEVLFLDEPFSALDYEMTLFIRDKLQEIFTATGVTMVLVSHDLEEAVYLSDLIVLLTKRPARVAEIVEFNPPRPRSAATLSTSEFISVKAHCLDVFQREVRK